MKISTRLAALALTVAAPLALAGTAEAAPTGSVSGVVWHDLNSNGLRDAGEPAIKGAAMYMEDTGTAVFTDEQGRYEFKNLTAGTYPVRVGDRSLSHGQALTRLGGTSKFHPSNGVPLNPVVVKAGQKVKHLDAGLVTAKLDHIAEKIYVSNPNPKVGDTIDIVGGAYPDGNAWDQFGGELSLPEGLRVVERLGGMPKFWETEPAGKVTGFFHDRRSPSAREFVGARVVVEKQMNGAELKFEVWKGLYRSTDTNTANDVATASLTTS
ncbi:SdrD B-like domain-containing protein [Lentzea sp. NPDC051838]|uniref:SdrD B-like domain-containing protein n=1 Tax=Lentzea sp. NPDC051838 TaxID=3154849 RepID=UPI00341681A5